MARGRGREGTRRPKRQSDRSHQRPVFIFAEGKVTEREYIDIVRELGTPADPNGREVVPHLLSGGFASKDRKPLPLVRAAASKLREERRRSKLANIKKGQWAWPQAWCLFDRDNHPDIPEAFRLAEEEDVRVAYSHPCFELWRLLHYQNYTSTFGGVCGSASTRLRAQPGFAATYGANVRSVSEEQAKHVMPGQRSRTKIWHAPRLSVGIDPSRCRSRNWSKVRRMPSPRQKTLPVAPPGY
jgi:hypothetical protein